MVSRRARENNTLGTRLSSIQQGMEALQAKTRTPAPTDIEPRLEVVERKLEYLGSANHRAEEELLVRGSNHAKALLDPNYVGPGPARITFNYTSGGTLSTDYYEWRGLYMPWGSRVVNMIRVDGRWFIDGHANESVSLDLTQGYGGTVKINTANNWRSYSISTGTYQYSEPAAQRLPSGIVILSGLVIDGTLTADTVIGTLPVGMRPDVDMIFPTINGNAWRSIGITTTGNILVRAGWTASFVTLDGIAFPAAGVASWTNVGAAGSGSSFANGWTGYATALHGTPAYWKDPYGLVWFKGLIGGGSRASDNLPMITLPASHRGVLQQHHPVTADEGFGFVGSLSTNGLEYKVNTIGSNWISLGGVTVVTPEALTYGTWLNPVFVNSWVNYNPVTFPAAAMTRRPDGLGLAKGLIGSGTVGAAVRVASVPKQLFPALSWLQPRPSGGASGRVDMYGHRGTSGTATTFAGQWGINFGSSAWVSIDGMKWMVSDT